MAKAAEAARPKPLSPDDRKKLLSELKSSDDRTLQQAGDKLSKALPTDVPDHEIASALAAAAGRTTGFPRASVARALAVWATPKQEKELIKLLSTGDFMVREPAIQGLARCPSIAVAKVLVEELKELRSRAAASKALRSMPAEFVEPELIPLLKNKDVFARGEAAKILQEIGTRRSIASLEELENSGLPFADRAARDAIRAIELREASK
jgi:HEAT repeat protein